MERKLQQPANLQPVWIDDPVWVPALKQIKWIVTDVDGVLTNGAIILDGTTGETKSFSVRDGIGVWLAREAGIEMAFLTGRLAPVVKRRAHDLGIQHVIGRPIHRKLNGMHKLKKQFGLVGAEILFIGDDIIDLPVFPEVGLAVAPADADTLVLEKVSAVTHTIGGRGVLREVIEAVLKAQGLWTKMMKEHLGIDV